jgi:Holliday junction resolvase
MVYTFRQSRGYTFEQKEMVKFFNNQQDWHARRMGGTSMGMPDVLITNNNHENGSILWAVECKSRTGKNINDPNNQLAYVPQDQIQRCYSMLEMFAAYKRKNVILAFRFATKKPRKHHYFFFRILNMYNVKSVTVTREGEIRYTQQLKEILCSLSYKKYTTFEKLMKNIPEPFTPTLII